MKNRDGSESNGYFGSSDHIEDDMIDDNGHMLDEIELEFGLWNYFLYRIEANIRTIARKMRRKRRMRGLDLRTSENLIE